LIIYYHVSITIFFYLLRFILFSLFGSPLLIMMETSEILYTHWPWIIGPYRFHSGHLYNRWYSYSWNCFLRSHTWHHSGMDCFYMHSQLQYLEIANISDTFVQYSDGSRIWHVLKKHWNSWWICKYTNGYTNEYWCKFLNSVNYIFGFVLNSLFFDVWEQPNGICVNLINCVKYIYSLT
jgi:hypothetical protein